MVLTVSWMPTLQLSLFISPPIARFQAPRQRKTRSSERKTNIFRLQISSQCNAFFESVPFDSVSAVNVLTSCTASKDLKLGSCIHARILKSGLYTNVFVNNALLGMYVKCGYTEDAAKLFERMPDRTVVSWTSMISGYCFNGLVDEAISIFLQMLENTSPNEFTLAAVLQACARRGDPKLVHAIHGYVVKTGFVLDTFLQSSLIGGYAKSGMLTDAVKLLERMRCRDVVSWTSVISGYVFHGMMEEAVALFFRMLQEGVVPNEVTILSILHACSFIDEWKMFQWVHSLVIKGEWCGNDHVLNSLVEMYSVNGYFHECILVFCEFCFRGNYRYLSPETMATLLQGCGHSHYLKLGEQFHGHLIKHGFFPSVVVENSLIDMYAENKQSDSAFQLFTRMRSRDIVSWNTMATSFAKNNQFNEVLILLNDVHRNREGDLVSPDFITMLTSIQACSNLALLQLGEVTHGYVTRTGLVCDVFIQNALIDMYGRTGRLDLAERVFGEMLVKDIGSWNSLIAAYGLNGNATRAIQVFRELKKSNIHHPNAITFINILSACSHAGMVREGFEIFDNMARGYTVEPSMEHFACLVDLLGRSGRLEEAEAFIRKMPVMPGPEVWGALLGVCWIFSNVDIAERAAKEISILEPESNVWRVALSNVYARVGKWDHAAKVRAEIRGLEGKRKEGGWSSVEVRGDMFKFMVNDTKHPESKLIYTILNAMKEHISYDRQQSSVSLPAYNP